MKRVAFLAMLSIWLALPVFAQEAVVVELSQTDASQAKDLYAAKVAADKAWDEAYSKIIGKYQGFNSGADFSKDFRFIVPKSVSTITTWNSGCIYGWPSGIYAAPAIGTPNWGYSSGGTGAITMPGIITSY
jgi:hypothetical protein